MPAELFELEMLGDVFERRYRKMRPDVEAMPWGTLELSSMSPASVPIRATQLDRSGVPGAPDRRRLLRRAPPPARRGARSRSSLIALGTRASPSTRWCT